MKYTNRHIFFENTAEYEQGEQFQASFFFKKGLFLLKASGLQFSFNVF